MEDVFSKPFCDLFIKQHKYFIEIYNLDVIESNLCSTIISYKS